MSGEKAGNSASGAQWRESGAQVGALERRGTPTRRTPAEERVEERGSGNGPLRGRGRIRRPSARTAKGPATRRPFLSTPARPTAELVVSRAAALAPSPARGPAGRIRRQDAEEHSPPGRTRRPAVQRPRFADGGATTAIGGHGSASQAQPAGRRKLSDRSSLWPVHWGQFTVASSLGPPQRPGRVSRLSGHPAGACPSAPRACP